MRFWDSSALVPLIVAESRTPEMGRLVADDPDIMVWYLTSVEVASALARRSRELPGEQQDAESLLDAMEAVWTRVDDARVVALARQLVAVHRLTAADALQLGAAVWAKRHEDVRDFVTLDHRLAAAARAEGFTVLPV